MTYLPLICSDFRFVQMKQLIVLVIFFISTLGFAQDMGSIKGYLLDLEESNAPLLYGSVVIKETGSKVLSDENGLFTFQNLAEGTYTLVGSFTGYETKETKIQVASNKTASLTLNLGASTISLDDLMLAVASSEIKSDTKTSNN
jgi:hypothetical protein